MKTTSSDVHDQLEKAGLLPFVRTLDGSDGVSINGTMTIFAVNKLRADPRFREGVLGELHPEVGRPRADFRTDPGTLGKGSLQVVINERTGRFHADLDRWSPYRDLVNFFGHAFGEVLPGLFRRKPKEQRVGDETV